MSRPGVRYAVRAVLALGVTASVAANVLAARPDVTGRIIAAWPPVALLLTIELISRVPVERRWLSAARLTAAAAVAGIAAWASYWHMVAVATRVGESPISAHLIPLSVDGMVVVASVCLVELGDRTHTPQESPCPSPASSQATTAPTAGLSETPTSRTASVSGGVPTSPRSTSPTVGAAQASVPTSSTPSSRPASISADSTPSTTPSRTPWPVGSMPATNATEPAPGPASDAAAPASTTLSRAEVAKQLEADGLPLPTITRIAEQFGVTHAVARRAREDAAARLTPTAHAEPTSHHMGATTP